MLKILGRITSINVRKVLWTADELGVTYLHEEWGTPPLNIKSAEYLALNPNGQIPVIIDDRFVLWESNAIMRYLAEPAGEVLIPADRHERARMEQWLSWQGTELNPSWAYAVMARLRKKPGFDDEAEIARSAARWAAKMSILEQQLEATSAYVAGDAFTLADIALGVSVHRWFATPIERPELPFVRGYYERLRQRRAGAPYMGEATP
jgi:glutathione S-transferase